MNSSEITSLNAYILALARVNPSYVAKELLQNPKLCPYISNETITLVMGQLALKDRKRLGEILTERNCF